jgi:hypothetical protein
VNRSMSWGAGGGVQSRKAAAGRAQTRARVRRQARRPPLPPSGVCVEAFGVEVLAVVEHEVGRATDPGREDAERFAFAVTFLETLEMGLTSWVVLEEEHGGLAERPLQVRVADLGALSANVGETRNP